MSGLSSPAGMHIGRSVVPLFTCTDAESPTSLRLLVFPTEQNVQHELLNTVTPHGSNQLKSAAGNQLTGNAVKVCSD